MAEDAVAPRQFFAKIGAFLLLARFSRIGVYALVFATLLIGHVASAQPIGRVAGDGCLPGIRAAEKKFALPDMLLQTIAIVESGRVDSTTGRVKPWPWTINVGGIGHFFETKSAAIEAVKDLQKAGTRSIDVGCLQINLMHHPNAFGSLDEAFDPLVNTHYGAHFLNALYQETGTWPQAAAAYHSRTQEIGASYEMRVMAIWPLASRFADRRQRGCQVMAPGPDLSVYTPAFAAQIRQQRADLARRSAMAAPMACSTRSAAKPAWIDYSRYTPEFAAAMREAARSAGKLATGSCGDRFPCGGRRAVPQP